MSTDARSARLASRLLPPTEQRLMRLAALPAGAGLLLALLAPCRAADAPDSHAAEFFEKSVRPVLAESCVTCHGPEKQRGGLRLDSKAALLKGADVGPVVV